MTRLEYEVGRRLLRDNGNYALNWLAPKVRDEFIVLLRLKKRSDPLIDKAQARHYIYGHPAVYPR